MPIKSGILFISGLFSLLDVILQMPLDKAIDEVAASGEISAALLDSKGQLSEVMKLIFAYEHANWHRTTIIMVRNGIDIEDLTKAYLDSLYWYRQLLDAIKDETEAVSEDGRESSETGDR